MRTRWRLDGIGHRVTVGARKYSFATQILGCWNNFGEMLKIHPLFAGDNDINQVYRVTSPWKS